MAVWSSLKYAFVASCTLSLTQVAQALPTEGSSGVDEWITEPRNNLFRRQNAMAFSGVQQGFGPAQGQVPVRKEIRELIRNGPEFNLFLLALQRFQQQPQTSETSYYGIAGIHGRPYKAWGNVFGGNNGMGYCTHSDLLFLSWHRPYLALYEQLIWQHASNIVNEFPADRRGPYAAVLPTLRIPYWDWASDATLPPQVGEWPQIQVDTPRGRQTINNPLYSYQFTDLREIPDQPFNTIPYTVRFPQRLQDGRYVTQPAAVNNALTQISGNLRNRVYQLLTAYKQYNTVSTKAVTQGSTGRFDSLEGVHDTIHGTVGSGGHMGFVDISAFDPVFFLHHTNIDRLFAIWQGINPGAYQFSGRSGMGTFAIPAGAQEDLNTALPPFRQSGNQFYTSATAANTKTFGYSYPETADWNRRPGTQSLSNDIIAAVNRLYGRGTPALSLRAAGTLRKRGISKRDGEQPAVLAEPAPVLGSAPPPESLAPVEEDVVDAGKYNEWVTDIKVNSAALKGTFNIYVFLGEPTGTPAEWATAKNLIGTHSVVTAIGGGKDDVVTGTVPLTSALLNMVVTGQLENLKTETVVPYLEKNLKLRVALTEDQSAVETKDVRGLTVTVAAATVTLPKTDVELPVWGDYEVKLNLIDVPKGQLGA
ncbi:Tyrosinase [Drechslerella dactyloides]|uniref:tyrosinase n=1 Tax=Drechslerella dactyloides TaxID=74499 RepID=A0AAD6NJA4_DREDA|nr:Tyrosinase [Drechslerella dactyloides]